MENTMLFVSRSAGWRSEGEDATHVPAEGVDGLEKNHIFLRMGRSSQIEGMPIWILGDGRAGEGWWTQDRRLTVIEEACILRSAFVSCESPMFSEKRDARVVQSQESGRLRLGKSLTARGSA